MNNFHIFIISYINIYQDLVDMYLLVKAKNYSLFEMVIFFDLSVNLSTIFPLSKLEKIFRFEDLEFSIVNSFQRILIIPRTTHYKRYYSNFLQFIKK